MRRTVTHAADHLKSYEDAAADWDNRRTNKPFKNYLSRDAYEAIVKEVQREASLLDTSIGIYEWPRAKIGYASFVDSIYVIAVLPG